MDEISTLQKEIAELTTRLATADANNAKAGEYGLKLIEEKSLLEAQYDQLQRDYDNTKVELESTRETLNQFRDRHRNAALSEFSREESLLEDKAKLEEEFVERVNSLENELKTLKQKLESTQQENDRLMQEYTEIRDLAKETEAERNKLKKELKELKDHEQKLLNDNDELGDENVKLLRQISSLRSAQVEFEAMKMEVARLIEENGDLISTVDEHRQLKEFAESEADKALQTAQQEREQKLKLKKELEQMRNHEAILNLNSLYAGMSAATKDGDQDRLNALETSIIADGPIDSAYSGEFVGQDLFSEIHGGEVAKLQEEKDLLSNQLDELKNGIGTAIGPLLQKLQITGLSDSSDVAKLKEIIDEAIKRLDKKLESATINKAMEKRVDQIKSDLRQMILLAGVKNAQLASAQDKIIYLGEIMGQLCCELSGNDENAPEMQRVRQIQSTLKSLAEQNTEAENKRSGSPSATNEEEADRDARSPKLHVPTISRPLLPSNFEQEISAKLGLKLEEILSEADRREKLAEETEQLTKSYDSFQELFKLIRENADRLVQSKATTDEDKDMAVIQQQLNKYKSLLNVKRDQVNTLRNVLRSNKTDSEGALNSVKSKYMSEMKIKEETIGMLRKELKQFKEDAATFASNRAMYTTRNEELKSQVETLTDELNKAKEEHTIISQLLRISIQQKLTANQRLADLEMSREHAVPQNANKRPARQAPNNNQTREPRTVRYPQQSHNPGQNGNRNSQFSPRGPNPPQK